MVTGNAAALVDMMVVEGDNREVLLEAAEEWSDLRRRNERVIL